MNAINLSEKLSAISDFWNPRVLADVNDAQVKLVKVQGEFVWHHHENEDEFFLVLEGRLAIQLRDGEVILNPGECVTIPRGVEHRPVAQPEASVLVFESNTTLNTGNIQNERTVRNLDRI